VQAFRATMTLSVYLVTLCMARGEKTRRQLMWAIVLGLILEAAATILLGRNGRGQRATGSIGQSNDLGAFLAVYTVIAARCFPRCAACGRAASCSPRWAWACSRSCCRCRVRHSSRSGSACSTSGLRSSKTLTALLIIVGLTSPLWAPDYVKDRIMGTSVEASGADGAELEAGARLRVDTWRAILELVNDHPFEGVGYGGLQYVLPQTGENLGVDVKDSSHNTFLRMLGEMGIFGLVLFLWLLVACWKVGLEDGEGCAYQVRPPDRRRGRRGHARARHVVCVRRPVLQPARERRILDRHRARRGCGTAAAALPRCARDRPLAAMGDEPRAPR
jgi:hypothetical protein